MRMEDIARLAGVSKSAVSFALSGKQGISEETRTRIVQIAKENGYLSKTKATIQGTTKSLTFLVFANSGIVLEQYYQQPFFRELIQYIEERCRSKGYSLLFTSVDMENFETDIQSVAEEKRSDGIILLGTNLSKAQVEKITDKLSPRLVVLDTCFETLPVHFVEINNVMGAYQAGMHLCNSGHTQIGYLASNVRIHNFDDRKRGFDSALQERGVEVAPHHTFSVAPTILSSQESLKAQLSAFIDSGNLMPTALFCECDYIAISAVKTLAELGFHIPTDISIVGFDNISESVIVTPELTTIHVEKETMAHLAVDLLIQTIESETQIKTKIMVDTQLVQRLSTGVPSMRDL